MTPRLLAILTTLGHVVIIVRWLRNFWAQLMEWTEAGKVEQRRLEKEAAERRLREADPWGQRALVHRTRAARLRAELRSLQERAKQRLEQRALVPFGHRIRRGPRRRKVPPP
jgi:hypothetical protein